MVTVKGGTCLDCERGAQSVFAILLHNVELLVRGNSTSLHDENGSIVMVEGIGGELALGARWRVLRSLIRIRLVGRSNCPFYSFIIVLFIRLSLNLQVNLSFLLVCRPFPG